MSNSILLGAVGDIVFRKGIQDGVAKHGLDWPFGNVRSTLGMADVLFGNMESVVVPPEFPIDQLDPRGLISPFTGAECAEALRRAGFTFMNLANNHVLDAGVLGLDHTKQSLEDAGIVTAGVGHNQEEARRLVAMEKGGIKIGYLCYAEDCNYTLGTRGPCFAYYDRDAVVEDICRYRDQVDILVVSIHADIEFMPVPSMPRLHAFREIASAGADVILGHHPHVPQGCEMIDGCLIAYSLGNFLFPAHTSPYVRRHGPATAKSFVLLIEVSKSGVRSFKRIPVIIGRPPEERPHLMMGGPEEEAGDYFTQLDEYLSDEDFLVETWRRVARNHLRMYLRQSMQPANMPRWRRAVSLGLSMLLSRLGFGFEPNVDLVVNDLVGRLCFTAENRSWMEEILAMGREAYELRNSQPADPIHRPHYFFEKK